MECRPSRSPWRRSARLSIEKRACCQAICPSNMFFRDTFRSRTEWNSTATSVSCSTTRFKRKNVKSRDAGHVARSASSSRPEFTLLVAHPPRHQPLHRRQTIDRAQHQPRETAAELVARGRLAHRLERGSDCREAVAAHLALVGFDRVGERLLAV